MSREEAKRRAELYSAFAEGKIIQFKTTRDEWFDLKPELICGFSESFRYRIKPEQKYRPFKNQEECWGEILKHECYGWVKSKDDNDRRHISSIQKDDEDNVWFIIVSFGGIDGFSSEQMFENFEFLDGTPFGIKEE